MHKLRDLMPQRPNYESFSRFRGIETLGAGCMGQVFRAYDAGIGEVVALKVSTGTESSRISFENEIRALSRIRHTNVVRLLDSGIFGDGMFSGRQFLVLGIIEGECLKDKIARDGRVGWQEARHMLMQLCDALSATHGEGIIHRDVKPDNVLISNDEATLLDFGVSQRIASKYSLRNILGDRFMPGNLDYTAPEVINGRCDGRTDIFSLGMLMRHMLSGSPPDNAAWLFGSVMGAPQDPIVRDEGIPKEQARIISCATEKSMDRRYPSASEMKAAIASV
jgi:serine/threonine protein kinase